MATPDSGNIKLLPRLTAALSMKAEDVTALSQDLYATATEGWLESLNALAVKVGVRTVYAVEPQGRDAVHVASVCRQDAESIARTWNADIARVLNAQFEVNRRSNRLDYLTAVEVYTEGRYTWKSKQISVQTIQKARVYAQERFYQENQLTALAFRYVGPPPVSDICKMRTAAGVVDYEYTINNPPPGHAGACIHEWSIVGRVNFPLSRIWLGAWMNVPR